MAKRRWGTRLRCFAVAMLLWVALPLASGQVLAATRQVATTGADAGDCVANPCRTISYAVAHASAGDTIAVAAGSYTDHVTVDRSLTLSGAGAATTTIDGGQAGRVFTVNQNVTATISGVTIQNGAVAAGDDGGGILNQGTLALANAVVQNNSATPLWSTGDVVTGGRGGGIANTSAGTLTITATTVTGNTAHTAQNPSDATDIRGSIGGGGIYNAGALVIQGNSAITNNTAETDIHGSPPGGTQKGGQPGGGGIRNDSGGTLSISATTISNNSAGFAYGGAICTPYIGGSNTITIDHSTISGNTAYYYAISVTAPLTITSSSINGNLRYTDTTFGNQLVGGGAIHTVQWRLTIRDSTVSNHTASNPAIDAEGGLELTRSVVSGNDAGRDGVPIEASYGATVTGSRITGNTGGGFGGLSVNGSGDLTTIADSVISGNRAAHSGWTNASGVGVTGPLEMSNTTIADNQIDAPVDPLTPSGGGLLVSADASQTVTITGTTISGNSGPATTGGLYVSGCGSTGIFACQFTMTNSTISGNAGGGVVVDRYMGNNQGPLTFTNVTIANNEKGIVNNAPTGYGPVLVRNTILSNTLANCSGTGAISSGGYNIENGNSCGFSGTDLVNTNPKLGPLQNNGGPTQTHAILAGSPAVDRVPPAANCPATDQRAIGRPAGAACDVGAYELRVDAIPPQKPGGPPAANPPAAIPVQRPAGQPAGQAPAPAPPPRP